MPYYCCIEGHLSYTAATGVDVACARCGLPAVARGELERTGPAGEDALAAEVPAAAARVPVAAGAEG